MQCTSPLVGSRGPAGLEGLRKGRPGSLDYIGGVTIRCGKCIACIARNKLDWSIRIYHEAHSTEGPCHFLTFTHNDASLPTIEGHSTVDLRTLQLLKKRITKHLGPFRSYAVGEYGTRTGRAHYHAAVFGLDLPDLKTWRKRRSRTVHRSPTLETKCWADKGVTRGHVEVEELTPGAASYVAGYVQKKLGRHAREEKYAVSEHEIVDRFTGEIRTRPSKFKAKEFALMSNRPGLGRKFVEEHFDEIFSNDQVLFRKKYYPVPKYYDQVAKQLQGDAWWQEHAAKRCARFGLKSPMEVDEYLRLEHLEANRQRQLDKQDREPG